MISKEEVKHIAKLARLELNEKEIVAMQKDMTEILDYFNLLKKVKGKPVKVGVVEKDATREDKEIDQKVADKLIKLAPDKKDRHVKVKAIF